MDTPTPPLPHSISEFVWLSVAAVLGYVAKQLPSLFRRQTPAESKKTEAEARQIDTRSMIEAGSMMTELMKLSAQTALDSERLRKEKEFWQAKAESELEARKAADLAREMAEKQLDELIHIGTNKPKQIEGIKLSDYDEPKG